MRKISTSKGCRSSRSVDRGLRPNASETCLPAPTNFPLGEDQLYSAIWLVLTLRIRSCLTEFGIQKPEFRIASLRNRSFYRNGQRKYLNLKEKDAKTNKLWMTIRPPLQEEGEAITE